MKKLLTAVFVIVVLAGVVPVGEVLAGGGQNVLGVGDCARVINVSANSGLNVRTGPGYSYRQIGRITTAEVVKIIDGPRSADSLTRWYVQREDGVPGWVAEGDSQEKWLREVSCDLFNPENNREHGPYCFGRPINLAIGDLVTVTEDGPPNRLRTGVGTENQVVGSWDHGETAVIVGGPWTEDGMCWFEINVGGEDFYTAEGDAERSYLERYRDTLPDGSTPPDRDGTQNPDGSVGG